MGMAIFTFIITLISAAFATYCYNDVDRKK